MESRRTSDYRRFREGRSSYRTKGLVVNLVVFLLVAPLTSHAQILSRELLASVSIVPISERVANWSIPAPPCAIATTRGSVCYLDARNRSLLIARSESPHAVQWRVPLPETLGPAVAMTSSLLDHRLALLVARKHPEVGYDLVLGNIRGDGMGGFRCIVDERERYALIEGANGGRWQASEISSMAMAPDGTSFWLATREKGEGAPTRLWRFVLFRGASERMARLVEQFPVPPFVVGGSGRVGGLAWWSEGLIMAVVHSRSTDLRTDNELWLLPWGRGAAGRPLASKMARGYAVVGLADAPDSLYLLLMRPGEFENSVPSLAIVPKLYPSVH